MAQPTRTTEPDLRRVVTAVRNAWEAIETVEREAGTRVTWISRGSVVFARPLVTPKR